MSTPDFNALLDKPADSFERPKPIPEGEYVATIGKHTYGKANNDKKTPKVTYDMGFSEALPSVDQEALALALGDKALTEKTLPYDLFITGDSMWRLGKFLVEHAGAEEGIPTREQIEQVAGRQVIVTVKHRPGRSPEDPPFAFIDSTAKMPD